MGSGTEAGLRPLLWLCQETWLPGCEANRGEGDGKPLQGLSVQILPLPGALAAAFLPPGRGAGLLPVGGLVIQPQMKQA